jgi:hypothetical protein
MRHVFDICNAVQKQELIGTVFEHSLYYENRVHRTPYMIPELSHNKLIMREKNLLIWDKKRGNLPISPSGGGEGIASASLRRSLSGWPTDQFVPGASRPAFSFVPL